MLIKIISLMRKILYTGTLLGFIGLLHAATAFAGTTTLSWDPPTTNADGTPLTDLAGFKIYYGTSSGNYTTTLDAGNAVTYVVNNLTPGTYYFTVTAYNTAGDESGYSNEGSKAIASTQYTLTTSKTGTGIGTITSSPGGISCGAVCSGTYDTGATVTLTAAPDASSVFSGWSGGCSGTGVCAIVIDAIKTVTATFTLKTYTITATAGSNGSISPGTVPVNYGANQTITITPNTGYSISNVLVDGTSVGAVTTYTFTNITANHTISATFAVNSYTITSSAGTGGAISPAGAVGVSSGASRTFTITPGTGYHVSNVLVDGASVGAVTAYTFTNITASHTIAASFAINAYTITPSAGTGGAISPASAVSVNYGSNQTITITPNTGYGISDVLVDGTSIGAVTTYTFTNTTANHTISASFRAVVLLNITCPDPGIPCVERTDGQLDANNLVNNNPKVDVEFEFRVVVVDLGGKPQYVRLALTQRSAPAAGDFYTYDMNCSGDFSTGALCTYRTKLGPAPKHTFYIVAKLSDSSLVTYPQTGYINGPQIKMLNGYNLVGVPEDVRGVMLDGTAAFGTTSTYRWVSGGLTANADNGQYEPVDTTKPPIKPGEGYFAKRASSQTLPVLDTYAYISDPAFTLSLKPGWNLISSPYGGNIRLSGIQVQKGTDTPIPWLQAAASNWLNNAVYYFTGSDWGSTYSYESAGGAPDAMLVPWRAYWVYLTKTDAVYSLIITKP